MLMMRPIERVTANPRMGPEPNHMSASAESSVVTWASTMVRKARE